jgi:predicted TPR repeat methyltransferase
MRSYDTTGDWQQLAAPSERPRYQALADMIRRHCPFGSVLDVGCGEAILKDYLPSSVSYHGVEPSALACVGARHRCQAEQITHATAEAFLTGEPLPRWDCILFNEMLYYTDDPLALVCRYATHLHSTGFLLISIYQKARSSLRMRLRSLVDRRQPRSNVHLTQQLLAEVQRKGWCVTCQTIAIPMSVEAWMVLRVQP